MSAATGEFFINAFKGLVELVRAGAQGNVQATVVEGDETEVTYKGPMVSATAKGRASVTTSIGVTPVAPVARVSEEGS